MQGRSLHGSCCVATPPLVQASRSHRLASVSSMVASDPCDALKSSDLGLCCMEIRSFGHGCVRGQKLRGVTTAGSAGTEVSPGRRRSSCGSTPTTHLHAGPPARMPRCAPALQLGPCPCGDLCSDQRLLLPPDPHAWLLA